MIRVNWIFARPVGDFWVIGPRSIRVIAFRKSDLLESDLLFNTINHLQVGLQLFHPVDRAELRVTYVGKDMDKAVC
jgi:hypothetical protein